MRIRELVLLAAVATVPLGLTACGGPSVEDFCEQYLATAEIEPEDGEEARQVLEDLADSVPDEAADEVHDAAQHMAEAFPEDGDLTGAVERGEFSEEDAKEYLAAADTVSAYGEENCQG